MFVPGCRATRRQVRQIGQRGGEGKSLPRAAWHDLGLGPALPNFQNRWVTRRNFAHGSDSRKDRDLVKTWISYLCEPQQFFSTHQDTIVCTIRVDWPASKRLVILVIEESSH